MPPQSYGRFPIDHPVTRFLSLINAAVFLLQQVVGAALIEWFAAWALGSSPTTEWRFTPHKIRILIS